MNQLVVRCLGGLEVRLGDRLVETFESSKVRALLAFLFTQSDRSFSRDQLAGLLWSEKPNEVARRNLRQAIYNLKTRLADAGTGSPILASGSELRIDPELEYWLDVEAFAEARRRGTSSGAVVPHYLAEAVAHYRGEFLAGFGLKDCPDFELWHLAEQERLRELAVETLRVLIDSYLSRGEFRLGIQYARRLVAIDPLSEHAHRALIRLYSLSGRRDRALTEYEQFRETLQRELGVEPMEETRKLYNEVLTEHTPNQEAEDTRGLGPLIPLVGRHESYRQLDRSWQSVLEDRCWMTLVGGEAGIGKTRLVKSFLDAASSQRLTTVLKGRCSEHTPTPYQPFAEVISNAFSEDSQRAKKALEADNTSVADLALLVPEIRQLLPGLPLPLVDVRAERERLFNCIARFFDRLSRSSDDESAGEPLVILLTELQWAHRETCDLLEYLLNNLKTAPIWILGTWCPANCGQASLIEGRTWESSSISQIVLEHLDSDAIEEITTALVGDDQAGELASFLIRHGEGLPLAIAERINSLWDERVLACDAGRWRLQSSLAASLGNRENPVRRRLRRLPSSTRRLASQAAIIGQKFDARLLSETAEEHPQVVEIGLELMLERWLIRQHSDFWRNGRREQDIVLWAKGARLGNFEFNHRLIWQAILEEITPLRRQIMHREVAVTLEKHLGHDTERNCETLAFHYSQANEWEQALPHLNHATNKAHQLSAADTAHYYGRQAVDAADRLCQSALTPEEEQTRLQEKARAIARLEKIKRDLTV